MQDAPEPLKRTYSQLTKTLRLLVVVFAGSFSAIAQEDVERATTKPVEAGNVTTEFEQLFRKTYSYLHGLDKYSARGTLQTQMKTGDAAQELSYAFAISKNGTGHFSMSVYRADGKGLVTRLLSSGRQGAANIYLPREMNTVAMTARIQDQPESLTVPVVLILYDFLEYSRLERWLTMLSEGRVTGPEDICGKTTSCLELTLNTYCTFRDFKVQIPVYEANSAAPKIAGLRMDLSKALREKVNMGGKGGDTTVIVELILDTWAVDTPPPSQDFAKPEPRTDFRSVGVAEIFALLNGRLPSSQIASQEVLTQMPSSPSALISRLKAANPAERARLVKKLRNTPAAANMKARARKMGLTKRDIQQLRSLVAQ